MHIDLNPVFVESSVIDQESPVIDQKSPIKRALSKDPCTELLFVFDDAAATEPYKGFKERERLWKALRDVEHGVGNIVKVVLPRQSLIRDLEKIVESIKGRRVWRE